MPRINYHGHEVVIDYGYSLARVSTTQQTIEGHERQTRLSLEFSEQFRIPLEQSWAITGSASKGYHIRKGERLSPFGVWLEACRQRNLKPNPVLLIESISRLSRLLILDGFEVVKDILNADCAIITLGNRRLYTKELLNRDKGLIFTLIAELQSAGTEAEAKSDYSRFGNAKRRNKPRGIYPGWLIFKEDRSGYEVIEWCVPILVRIFHEATYLSVDQIAARLNAEGVPIFPSFNHRKPNRHIWHGSYITKIIRSRAVRGEIEMGRYDWETYADAQGVTRQRWKRKLTGLFEMPYPVIERVTEDMWQRANAALDARQTGRGPKGEGFANLFQGIAKCAHCGSGAMKLISTAKMRSGRERKRYHYYRCANSLRHACKNPILGPNDRTFDYAQVEGEFIAVFKDIIARYLQRATPQDDPTVPFWREIRTKQAELSRLERREKSLLQSLKNAQQEASATEEEVAQLVENLGLARDKAKLKAEIDALDRKLEQVKAQLPSKDVVEQVRNLVTNLNSENDQYAARAKVNMQLRHFIARIEFAKQDGMVRVIYGDNGEPYPPDPHGGWRHDFTFCFTPEGVKRDGQLEKWKENGERIVIGVATARLGHARSQAKRTKP